MTSGPELAGRYEIFPSFAHGGMATMHVGRLRGPGGFSKLVAVKRQSPMMAASDGDGPQANTLLEEARVAARIRSPFVVPIIELLSEGDQLSIVMELVHGVPLSALLACAAERGVRVPIAVGAAILADVLRGLHAAHEATDADGRPLEIVHRDVSPQNVLVGVDGVSRVVDFGIARALGREGLTATGEVKGKLAYIAPEQLRPGPVTRQADIYAAGVVLWETLVGEKLREEGSANAILALFDAPSPLPSSRFATIPPALDDVVSQALSREPRDRFPSGEAMAFALEEACAFASRDDVSRFVERVAFEPLETLAEAMQSADRHVSDRHVAEGFDDAPPSLGLAPMPPAVRPRPHFLRGLILGFASAAAIGALVLASRWSVVSPVASVEVAPTAAPSAFSSGAPVERASAAPASAPPAAVEPASAGLASAAPVPKAFPPPLARAATPPAPLSPSARGAAAPLSRRAAAPLSARDCTPPYTIDEAGIKHYKPACIP